MSQRRECKFPKSCAQECARWHRQVWKAPLVQGLTAATQPRHVLPPVTARGIGSAATSPLWRRSTRQPQPDPLFYLDDGEEGDADGNDQHSVHQGNRACPEDTLKDG